MFKKIKVDELLMMKLTKKSNPNLVYYLAKTSIDDKLVELGYERKPKNKCVKKDKKQLIPIEDVISGWKGEEFLCEPVFKRKIEGKSIIYTQDEFKTWLFHESFENSNMVYDIKVMSHPIYNYVPDTLEELYRDFNTAEDVVWDIETTGLNRFTDEITSVQFSWISKDSGEERTCFLEVVDYPKEDWAKLFKHLGNKKLVAHNGKFDSLFIYEKYNGVQLPLTDDTMCMSHCTDNEEYGLKPNVLKWFHHDYDITTKDKTGNVTNKLILYGILDVYYTRKLKNKLEPRLDKLGTRKIYNHEMRAYRAYYKVEQVGVPLSDKAGEISKQLEEEASLIEERLNKVANINWGSNDQVATVMFSPEGEPIYSKPKKHKWVTSVLTDTIYKTKKEATDDLKAQGYKPKDMGLEAHTEVVEDIIGYGLGLKPKCKTSSGKYAVGKDTLAEYADNPVIKDLIEWKSLYKLKQFPDKWMEISHNGRIYPSFNLTARTGRTTCSNPNLQQCPQSSAVRNLIGGKKGMKVIENDFSQAELRVASMFANDKNMQDAYNSGSDLHSKTTELLFGDTSQLSHDEQKRKRTQAKSCFTGDTEISVCFVDDYGMKHNFDMRLDFLYNNLDEDCTLNTAWYKGKVYLKGFDTDTLKEKQTNKFSMIKQTNATVYHYEAVKYKLEFKITGNHRCFVFDDRTSKFDVVTFSNLNHHHYFVVIEKDKFVLRQFCADYITETKSNVDVYCVQSAMDNMIVKSKNSVNHIYFMNCNFGFLYGMSAKTFVDYAKGYGLNLSQEESEKLRNDFFNAYPRLPKWHDECKAYLREHGYSYSPSGRKRFFPQVYSDNPRVVASAERGCVNAGVQGFASDLCVSALADVVFSEELDHSKFNVVGSVHDAILIEVQEDYAQELGEKVQKIMSHPSILDDLGIEIPVPLKADLSIGDAWGMEE